MTKIGRLSFISTFSLQLVFKAMSFSSLASGLLLGVSTSGWLVGCADEHAPETWVKRLDDTVRRSEAIKRLGQFYEDALTSSKNDVKSPEVQKVADLIVTPLTEQYIKGGLDEKTRKELAKRLGDMRDLRTQPALVKMLKDYDPEKSEEDSRAAAESILAFAKEGRSLNQETIDALWDCFIRFRPSQSKLSTLVAALSSAVLVVKHSSYVPKAIAKLGEPVGGAKDPKEMMDKIQFWQATSLRLLRELAPKEAVKPIVEALLSPAKGDLEILAMLALSRMPKESEAALAQVLKVDGVEFKRWSSIWAASQNQVGAKGFILPATRVLGFLSRPSGQEAVLAVLPTLDADANLAELTRTLVQYPTQSTVSQAFVSAYSRLSTGVDYGSTPAKAVVLAVTYALYDPKLLTWVVKETMAAKGAGFADNMHTAGIASAVKMFGQENESQVEKLIAQHGLPGEKEVFKISRSLIQKCKQDMTCYVSVFDDPIPPSPPSEKFRAIKAAWMVGAYGDEKAKQDMLSRIPKMKDPIVRADMVQALDKLCPKGDEKAADVLDKIVQSEGANSSNDLLTKIALKLRSRAAI